MSGMLQVVVNADDFGLSTRVNSEVERLHQKGVLTSATIMANGPALEEVRQIHVRNPALGLGVHLNASNFQAVTPEMRRSTLCDAEGSFHLDFRNRFGKQHIRLLVEEWTAQIRKVQSMGIQIDHLDSHHHVHTSPLVFPVVKKVSKSTGIRWVRNTRNLVPSEERTGGRNGLKYALKTMWSFWLQMNGISTTKYFCSVHDLETLISSGQLNVGHGILELMCHPGDDANSEYVEEIKWLESELEPWIQEAGSLKTFGNLKSKVR